MVESRQRLTSGKDLSSRCGYRYAATVSMAACRVLVVEDDDSLRRVTQLHLEKLGFPTTAAPDAEEALGILGVSPYDVLLTDLHLPGMSGVDLLKRVKLEYPETIVIVV